MKESIGGTWLFGIVITFIVFFTTYISVSTNYAKCFKIKDEMLMTIEHYRGVNQKSIDKINSYLENIGYYSEGKCVDSSGEKGKSAQGYSGWVAFKNTDTSAHGTSKGNYCIRRYVISAPNTGPIGHPSSAYYQVVVFFKLDWPIINTIFNVRIEGETSVIHQFYDQYTFG